MLSQELVSTIISTVRDTVHPYAIILFGTAAHRQLRPDSDIDIAFLADSPCDELTVFRLGQELSVQLNRDIDLIDLSQASTVFQAQILSTGKVIDCDDKDRLLAFHALTLKQYARLNEERQCIFIAEKRRMGIRNDPGCGMEQTREH
ncbi:type VII toxin-antitoxin system MntA family adenylyltransferase antitoxin [Heliophilum fasciatum]|uniref:Nucleotidyltransferase-like protein n=1 Tax=Heliophilum fasciatum TaxID=35700 RepID=A0A4R2RKA1_9FIRM|nr:nucleotidyltransferase domain-containing protein [Heliophilum fasciatum]MCW2278568.1 putative nucleotidyltransferase [Heliophilum fasciatum]TCP63523.1 nucleotidyltransferase-like protein [Heliophilum fasciatum]